MYVYIKTESDPNLWTAGFFNNGTWYPESDYPDEEAAAERVHWLNGGDRIPFRSYSDKDVDENPESTSEDQ